MGDVVPLHPSVTVEQVKAAKWTASMHADLAKGGTLWVYGCEEHPRLAFSDLRQTRNDKAVRTFACDDESFPTFLEAAVAALNGDPIPPPPEPKMPEPQAPKKVSLAQMIEEVDYELHQRERVYPNIERKEPRRKSELAYHVERMTAVRDTLQWLQENEADVREYVAQKRKKPAPAEAGAVAGG